MGAEIVDLPVAMWASTIAGNLTSHFVAARGVAPALDAATTPTYLLLNGIASLEPCIGSGAICVAGVGQTRLVDMLRGEQIGARVRFRQLTILGDVLLTGGAPASGQVGIDTVAEKVADMLASADGPDDATIEADDSEAALPP